MMNLLTQIWLLCSALLLTSPPILAAGEQPLVLGPHERLLVLAPHPDDESLSAAGLITQVFQHGGTVRSVVVTAGDAYVEAIQRDPGKKIPQPAIIEFTAKSV